MSQVRDPSGRRSIWDLMILYTICLRSFIRQSPAQIAIIRIQATANEQRVAAERSGFVSTA